MTESSSSLLCVVLDLNPLAWGLKTVLEAKHAQESGKQQAKPETIVQGIDAVLTFINSYLLMTHGNQVAVVGVHPKKTEFLFPTDAQNADTATAAQVNQSVATKFRQLLSDPDFFDLEETEKSASSRLAAGLAKALCYINRQKKKNNLNARCLVVKCGMDTLSNQYLALINGAFAAQEMDVSIDAVVLDRDGNNAALQQVCSVSNGIYTQVREPSILLQLLLVYHLADDESRKNLAQVPQSSVDARATCFTSQKPVDIGHVCSVCLSVYATFTPICGMCDSVFRMPQLTRPLKRKRK